MGVTQNYSLAPYTKNFDVYGVHVTGLRNWNLKIKIHLILQHQTSGQEEKGFLGLY